MEPRRNGAVGWLAAIAAVALATACKSESGPGRLAVMLQDGAGPAARTAASEADEVWVNLTAVRAHVAGEGWRTIREEPLRVDLRTLGGRVEELGVATIAAGKVTQLRLVVAPEGNEVVVGGVSHPLTVPSGAESGIKITGPWTIGECEQTAVTIEFDGRKSIWYHPTGAGDDWILRPVIHVKKAERTDASCEPAEEPGEPGGAGDACADGPECLSGTCTEGVCEPGGPGESCADDADCASGACELEAGSCGPGDAGGAGEPCVPSTDCLSNACVEAVCAPGGQESPCAADGDCAEGFSCASGACVAVNAL